MYTVNYVPSLIEYQLKLQWQLQNPEQPLDTQASEPQTSPRDQRWKPAAAALELQQKGENVSRFPLQIHRHKKWYKLYDNILQFHYQHSNIVRLINLYNVPFLSTQVNSRVYVVEQLQQDLTVISLANGTYIPLSSCW